MAHHEVVQCSCGTLIAQCRCMAPHKPVRVVEYGCVLCQEILRQQPQLASVKKPAAVPQEASIC